VELKAPVDGFVIEQNVSLHETVVDNTTNLFQIARVDPLVVLASVPEDDLPALQELKEQTQNHISWTVRTVGSEPIAGFVDDIGYLIDPNQHTAVVRGHIPNLGGVLRAGQFVTATVELLPPKDVVEVPIGALVEDGKESIVFVQDDPAEKDPVSLPVTPLHEGERVLAAGALELKTALENKQSENIKPEDAKAP
jgi:cobalt-zinc-cadmium efflux system membrane fusion protein